MSVTLDCTSAPFVRCSKIEISLKVVAPEARNANNAMVGPG
jgi:hypothetical protein